MAVPSGVSVCNVYLNAPISFIGEAGRVHLEVRPSVPLTFVDEDGVGHPLGNFISTLDPENGVAAAIVLPHVDQDGFLDSAGNAYTGWFYTASISYEYEGQMINLPDRDFQVVAGQLFADLSQIVWGIAEPAMVAPIPTVTSIEGMTGAVTLAGLGVTAALAGKAPIAWPKFDALDNILYVSKAGNDANDGRAPGNAKLKIQSAIDALKNAGKHGQVRVGAGVFTEDITLRDGISVIGAGSNMSTIKAPVGSTAPGAIQIADGPVTGMQFSGFRIEGSGNAGQHGMYIFARSSPAPAYPHAGWWYSRCVDVTVVNFLGRAIWLRGGGSTYMLPHQFLVFEMCRFFTSVAANTEALVMSGQVGQIDWIQCEFDSDDDPPYGDVMSVPNIYICPQLNDNGTFADEENPYAVTFHTPTIQNGWKAVYATHPSFTEFIAPHLEGFKFGFHADSGAGLMIRGGGFSNVGGQGGGTGYWTNTTIGGQIGVYNLRGGGAKDKAHISDGNLGSFHDIRDSISKGSPGNETTNLTKQTSVQGDGSIPLQGNRSVICSTSATAATSLQSNAAPGESLFIEAFGGPLTFSTGNGLRLGGRSSITIPDGAVAHFTRLDILNNWALVGHTPGASTSISANYTPTTVDRTILATAGAGGITVTLPVAPRGTRLDIKKTDSAAGAVTVAAGAGNTIEGAASFALPNNNDAVALESNGTTWFVLAQVGKIRFRKGSAANAFEVSDNNDNLRWGIPGAVINGYASNGTSVRMTLDTNDTPTNGRFNSQLFGSGKHVAFSNSGTEVWAVADTGKTTIADDVEITNAAKGAVLKSPDGSRWRITVGDDGALTTTKL
jgi:hypothetical protein